MKQSLWNMEKEYYVYMMTNQNNRAIYTGVTNDLKKRIYEHEKKLIEGFTKKYNITKSVYYEVFNDIKHAITREKQIKGGSRTKKIAMVNKMNPEWKDLYENL
jgi:putative endonuclease